MSATDSLFLFGFLMVFIRCSAMLLASPLTTAGTTPVQVRVLTALAVSAAIGFMLREKIGPPPSDLGGLAMAVMLEVAAGLVIGWSMTMVIEAAEIGGAIMDLEVGLGMSAAFNPINGVNSTALARFKHMLAFVVFLAANGHHVMFEAFVHSYDVTPSVLTGRLGALDQGMTNLLGQIFLIGVEMAAPVIAVGFLVDASLALMNRAVPQLQVAIVGLPAKTALGLLAVAVGLPVAVSAVSVGTHDALRSLAPMFR